MKDSFSERLQNYKAIKVIEIAGLNRIDFLILSFIRLRTAHHDKKKLFCREIKSRKKLHKLFFIEKCAICSLNAHDMLQVILALRLHS